jgi:hypothetical protein
MTEDELEMLTDLLNPVFTTREHFTRAEQALLLRLKALGWCDLVWVITPEGRIEVEKKRGQKNAL